MKSLVVVAFVSLWACSFGHAGKLSYSGTPTHPQDLPMSDGERSNLEMVEDWWRLVIESGHLEYVPRYQAPDYIQHNPEISTGRDAFLAAFAVDNHPINPIPSTLSANVPLAGARGDYVWMMRERQVNVAGSKSGKVWQDGFDLLRLANGQIQEHWDTARKHKGVGLVRSGVSPHPSVPFSTGQLTSAEECARAVALRAAREVYLHHPSRIPEGLFARNFVEHDPNAMDAMHPKIGLDMTKGRGKLDSEDPALVLVNGGYVFMMWRASSPDPDVPKARYSWSYFQVFHVLGGKIDAHWDQERR